MGKWEAGVINANAAYISQTSESVKGVYQLENQLRHKKGGNWPQPPLVFNGFPDDDGQRVICEIIIDATTNDDDSDYSIDFSSFDDAAATGLTGRLYLAIKCTASTAYYNDFCIGGVQITNDSYGTLDKGWAFSVLGDYTDWEYATVTGLNTLDPGYENYTDIITAAGQTWDSCIAGVANARISRNSSTGSSNTGAADGISAVYSSTSSGTILDGGSISEVEQSIGNYMFTESSGTSANIHNKWWWVRSPEITLDDESDMNLAIAYHAATIGTVAGMEDAADDQLLRWWWIPTV